MIDETGHKPKCAAIRFRWGPESGQGLIELGILVPVLVFILVGVVDFGRILMVRHVVTNAAREGARVASVDQKSSKAYDTVRTYLQNGGLNAGQAAITINGANATSGQMTDVTVTYPVTSLILQMVHASSNTITLRSASSLPHE